MTQNKGHMVEEAIMIIRHTSRIPSIKICKNEYRYIGLDQLNVSAHGNIDKLFERINGPGYGAY